MVVEPILRISYRVVAYDESGYGDNMSKNFSNGEEAVNYAKSLDHKYYAKVYKDTTMQPIYERIWPEFDE